MAHRRALRHSGPGDSSARGHDLRDIDRIGRHHELASVAAPALARPVGIDLDAEPVRIGEIERFADQVVAGAGVHPEVGEMVNEPAERRPVRQQDREVEEPEPAATGGPGAAPLAQLDERTGTRAEDGDAPVPSELGEAEGRAVELERALEVSDLERDGSDRRCRRQAEAARRLAVAAGRRRLDGRRCTEDVAGSYAHDRLLVTTVRQPG